MASNTVSVISFFHLVTSSAVSFSKTEHQRATKLERRGTRNGRAWWCRDVLTVDHAIVSMGRVAGARDYSPLLPFAPLPRDVHSCLSGSRPLQGPCSDALGKFTDLTRMVSFRSLLGESVNFKPGVWLPVLGGG